MFATITILLLSTACNQERKTPKEFLNHSKIDEKGYQSDSTMILINLYSSLQSREGFFNNSSYDNSTELIIDTLVYSPDFKKLAAFIMTKNLTSKQLAPDKTHVFYYDAACFLGIRGNDSIKLNWLGPNFTNTYDKNELSALIRDEYFNKFVTPKDDKSGKYKYNLNDTRFWDSPIWQEFTKKNEWK